MTSKSDADEYYKRQDLQAQGIDTRPYSSVHLHGPNETPRHLVLKALVARELLNRRGPKRWDTEVQFPEGRVDVLDYGEPDEPAAIYEIESDCTRQDRLDKARQYGNSVVPEERVYFLDPKKLPPLPPEYLELVRTEVVG